MSGRWRSLPGSPDDDHRDRAVAAARHDATPLERVEREVDVLAARADRPAQRASGLDVAGADHDAAADRQLRRAPPPSPRTQTPRRSPGRRGRASAPRRAPRARSRARTTRTGTVGRVVAIRPARTVLPCSAPAPSPWRSRARCCRSRRPARSPAAPARPRTPGSGGCRAAHRGTSPRAGGRPSSRPAPRSAPRASPRLSIARTQWITSAPSTFGSIPGTRWTPSSTSDQPSWSARSITARTPIRTFWVWSTNAPSTSRNSSSSGRLEARPVDRRHELRREERAHRLADEIGRADPRDPEPVGDLGRDRRLPGAGRAADQEDDRQVELAQRLVPSQAAECLRTLVLAEHLDRELFEAREVDRGLAARERDRPPRGQRARMRAPLGRRSPSARAPSGPSSTAVRRRRRAAAGRSVGVRSSGEIFPFPAPLASSASSSSASSRPGAPTS